MLADFFKPKAQPESEAEASHRMLQMLKERRGEETGKWLALMRDQVEIPPPPPPPTVEDVDERETVSASEVYTPPLAAQYTELIASGPAPTAATAVAPARAAAPAAEKNETVDWVKKLFQEFARQATEFNATASGTEMVMTVRPPEFTFETPHYGEYDPQKKISVFKGHIATRHWAMLIQGYNDRIDVYVIPSESILNFTLNDIRKSELSPFMTLALKDVQGQRVWSTSGHPVMPETMPLLAKELLGDLVRISSGTMSESELFAHHEPELKLGETVAQGYAPKPVESRPASNTAPTSLDAIESVKIPAIETMATWPACNGLLKAIYDDLARITSSEGAIDPAKDQTDIDRLHEIAGRLRTLSGELSGLLAQYHPAGGSKYNPS
jgi:hypothetical protein